MSHCLPIRRVSVYSARLELDAFVAARASSRRAGGARGPGRGSRRATRVVAMGRSKQRANARTLTLGEFFKETQVNRTSGLLGARLARRLSLIHI